MIEVLESAGLTSFLVRVQPGASRTETGGEWQGALRIRLAERARDGRANEALRRLLAARLKVPKGAVKIVRGEHSRAKRVEISGVTVLQVRTLMLLTTS